MKRVANEYVPDVTDKNLLRLIGRQQMDNALAVAEDLPRLSAMLLDRIRRLKSEHDELNRQAEDPSQLDELASGVVHNLALESSLNVLTEDMYDLVLKIDQERAPLAVRRLVQAGCGEEDAELAAEVWHSRLVDRAGEHELEAAEDVRLLDVPPASDEDPPLDSATEDK